jgi:ribonuclease P protein component
VTKNKKEIEPKKKTNDFEWLKSKNEIELVYKSGQTLVSKDKKLRAKYFFVDNKDVGEKVKAGLLVSSDKGNSVWRNRMKRILRELIKKEKFFLLSIVKQKKTNFLIIFSPHSITQNNFSKISLKDITAPMNEILSKLTKLSRPQ